MFVIPVRTLRREFRVHCDCRESARTLAFIKARPEIVRTTLEVVDIYVERIDGFYRLGLPNGIFEGTPSYLADCVRQLAMTHLINELPGAPLVPAVTIRLEDKPFLLVGGKQSGRTTLALDLIERGFLVEGAEYVAIRETDAVTCPLTLKVPASSLDFVPALASRIRRAPFRAAADGARIYAISPAIGTRVWQIRPICAPKLVVLIPNNGGHSVATPISTDQSFRWLMAHSAFPEDRAEGAARLRRLAREVQAWEMSLGDFEGARRHLTAIARYG